MVYQFALPVIGAAWAWLNLQSLLHAKTASAPARTWVVLRSVLGLALLLTVPWQPPSDVVLVSASATLLFGVVYSGVKVLRAERTETTLPQFTTSSRCKSDTDSNR